MSGPLIIRAGKRLTIARGGGEYEEGSELDLLQACYLVYTGRARALDEEGREVGIRELFAKYARGDLWWILFTVFNDLVSRGRRVKRGYGDRDLVVEHEGKAYRVFVTEEGASVPIVTLLSWIEGSQHKDLAPVIAVVDMYGDVTYYQPFSISFKKIFQPHSGANGSGGALF